MRDVLSQPALQEQTLGLYGELVAFKPEWAHRLVLGRGQGCSTSGFPAACSLAGAASLLLEGQAAQAKAALRDGGLDFVVSTVDEALRTLKNEVRRGRALAVALTGDVEAAEEELRDRGVLPDLLFSTEEPLSRDAPLSGWADVRELSLSAAGRLEESDALRGFLKERGLAPHTWKVSGRAALKVLDEELLGMLSEDDTVRRRWLLGVSKHQRSAGETSRAAWVTPEECGRISAAGERMNLMGE